MKEARCKRYVFYDSTYRQCPEKQLTRHQKQISGCGAWGRHISHDYKQA